MNPKVIAFYLPQYYPVKENNEWFGNGFTEWTNVGRAKPLFKNHYQPKIPADLGYYDLRIPEVREQQAHLAKEAGVAAFCYYHYWFGSGKQLLEMPITEIVKNKKPHFPFCLCWANHSWYKKNWNPDSGILEQNLLIEQTYPGDDDIIQHFLSLLPIFRDNRYYKIDGKLLFVIYDAKELPDFIHFKKLWNALALNNGLPPFFFIAYSTSPTQIKSLPYTNFDAVILSLINNIVDKGQDSCYSKIRRVFLEKVSSLIHYPRLVVNYSDAIKYLLDPIEKDNNIFPTIVPNWDYTARRGAGGLIIHNSTPQLFREHVKQAMEIVKNKPEQYQILFLKSWNEWGEGNYMEPDLKFGKGYIRALRQAIEDVI